jgi:uncharacterized membrane protein
MESKAKLFGHPIHPMLIVFPLGLLATAVLFDIMYLIGGNELFPIVSFWNITAGIVGGLVAGLFGLIDWLAIPGGTRAKSVGAWHGLGNVTIVVLFFLSWLLRQNAVNYEPSSPALALAFAGAGLAVVTGWLGGELVDRLGVGVDPGANLNAPSSLSGKPVLIPQTGSEPGKTEDGPGFDRS